MPSIKPSDYDDGGFMRFLASKQSSDDYGDCRRAKGEAWRAPRSSTTEV